MMKTIFLLILIVGSMMGGKVVWAGEADFLQLLNILYTNGTLSEQQFNQLSNSMKSPVDMSPEQGQELVVSTVRFEADVQVETKGGVEVASSDGQFSFEFGGRLMIDGTYYAEDKNDLGNGTELRRARLETEGVLFGDYNYEFAIDFSDSSADIKDAYIGYDGWWPISLTMGQFKEPFSLEELTSSKSLTFMERALPNEFAPGRTIGVGIKTEGELLTAAVGLFGEAFDDGVDSEEDEGWALTSRMTYAPFQDRTRALHFGAAFSAREPDESEEVKFKTSPESHLTDIKYLDTGKIAHTKQLFKYGLEVAGVYGPFSLQGEYIRTSLDREETFDDVDFDGWYLFGSWFITGESRPYDFGKGTFAGIKPRTPGGAVELAVRYSVLDLNNGPISGGKEENITFGLNWYLNKKLRLMANYILINNDDQADADGDVLGNDDPKVFQTRLQLHF